MNALQRRRGGRGILVGILAVAAGVARGDETGVVSKITEVTVYADRARVTRVASVRLGKGGATYSFARLPGWLDEDSVRAAIVPAAAARIADVQIRREFLARSDDEELRKAEAAVLEMSDQVNAIDDESKVLQAKAKQVEDIKVFSMEKLPKDAAAGAVDVKAYGSVVDFVAESLRAIATARRDVQKRKRDLAPELEARQRRLAELQQRRQLEERTVRVSVEAPAGGTAELSLVYMLPGATWEPVHELRAAGPEPQSVAIASFAAVSQSTGEDWNGAALLFSTQSPTVAIRIPELEALRLGVRRTGMPVPDKSSVSFSKAKRIYEAQNPSWNRLNVPNLDFEAYLDNNKYQREIEQRTTATFERLQKRGTTAVFTGAGRPAVRSDGRAVRVPIGEVDLPAKHQIVAVPEMSLNAVRTVELTNRGSQPILPGQVALYQEGAFLGLTDVDFVAEGQEFAVLLGIADQIKLSRVMDRRRSSLVRGDRTRMQVAFDVTAENLADAPAAVRLNERIPVSEDREIRVFGIDITPEIRPDSKGLLTWNVNLAPKEKQTLRIAYGIEYPTQMLQERQMMLRSEGPAASAPAASDIQGKIMDLEAAF